MSLSDYKDYLSTAFPKAVKHLIDHPEDWSKLNTKVKEKAQQHYEEWGFDCIADCLEAAVPRSTRLQLEKWSASEISVEHWKMLVSCRSDTCGAHTHIEVRNLGHSPLPFTETGYRSFFIPLGAFQDGLTPRDFIEAQFPEVSQLELF